MDGRCSMTVDGGSSGSRHSERVCAGDREIDAALATPKGDAAAALHTDVVSSWRNIDIQGIATNNPGEEVVDEDEMRQPGFVE